MYVKKKKKVGKHVLLVFKGLASKQIMILMTYEVVRNLSNYSLIIFPNAKLLDSRFIHVGAN